MDLLLVHAKYAEFVGGDLSLVKTLMIDGVGNDFQKFLVWLSPWWGLGYCSW